MICCLFQTNIWLASEFRLPVEYPGEISCWISLVPTTDSEGVSEGEQSPLCGEIGKSASCEFPVCKPHYSTVIIIITLIDLIFILRPLIWLSVLGVCQYVNQQRCRAKTALTGGFSWLSMGKEVTTFSKTMFPKPRCSVGLTFYTAILLIGSQNRWPFVSVLLRNIQWTPSLMALWKFLLPVKRWPTELSVAKMHVSICSCFFFEAIYISLIGDIFCYQVLP